jgi:hypothetical protein
MDPHTREVLLAIASEYLTLAQTIEQRGRGADTSSRAVQPDTPQVGNPSYVSFAGSRGPRRHHGRPTSRSSASA